MASDSSPVPTPAVPGAPGARSAARRRGTGIAPVARDDRDRDTTHALDALRRVVRTLRISAARAEADTGLSAAQLFVLQQVAAAPGQWLTALAERTMTDRTSVAAAVERLVARDLVRRVASEVDRRRVEIHPTDAGRAVLAHAPHPPTRRVLDGMHAMTTRDLRRLAVGLRGLVAAMGLGDGPAPMLFDDASAHD